MRRRFWYRCALVALVVCAGVYVERRDVVSLRVEHIEAAENVSHAETRLAEMQAEAAELERRVEYLRSDPVELEAAIRAEKKLVREGERIYRIVLPDEQPQ